MELHGIGSWEFLLILAVILVVVGPARVPGVLRKLGRIIRIIRRAGSDLTEAVCRDIGMDGAPTRAAIKAGLPGKCVGPIDTGDEPPR